VAGLAWNAIRSTIELPPGIGATIAARSERIATDGLRAAAQSAAISTALDKAGIPHLFVKGLAVGALAYGNPFIKHSWDIDVLVDDSRIEEGASVLSALDFELAFPDFGADWRRLARWHRVQKDSAWRHRTNGQVVELHGRLADNPLLLPTINARSPNRRVDVAAGVRLPTLKWPETFAHLCVHGASSSWFRLTWLSDLAALLRRQDGEVESLYNQSQQLGAGRAAAQALLLVHELFGIELGEGLSRLIRRHATNRWLAKAALRQLCAGEPSSRAFGTATIHASQFLLLPGISFKAEEARRQTSAALSNLFD